MSNVKITSKNQTGGITAQNVNTSGEGNFSVNEPPEKEGKLKSAFWWIFGLIGATAAVLGIIKYFSLV